MGGPRLISWRSEQSERLTSQGHEESASRLEQPHELFPGSLACQPTLQILNLPAFLTARANSSKSPFSVYTNISYGLCFSGAVWLTPHPQPARFIYDDRGKISGHPLVGYWGGGKGGLPGCWHCSISKSTPISRSGCWRHTGPSLWKVIKFT